MDEIIGIRGKTDNKSYSGKGAEEWLMEEEKLGSTKISLSAIQGVEGVDTAMRIQG